MAVFDAQAQAVPHDSERASTVAGGAAVYALANNQARAMCAASEEASEEARIEAEHCSAQSTTHALHQEEAGRRMETDRLMAEELQAMDLREQECGRLVCR